MLRYYSQTTPRVVVVGEILPGGECKIAVSRCSKKDQFVRKIGRSIAEGRLNSGKCFLRKGRMIVCEDAKAFVASARLIAELVAKDARKIYGV